VADSLFYLFFSPVFIALSLVVLFVHNYCKQDRDVAVAWGKAKSFASGCTTMMLFMLQPSLVKRCALVFSCTRLGAAPNDIFMTEDLAVRCWESEHLLLVCTLGLGFLVLYVIGIPFAVYFVLSKNVKAVRLIITMTGAKQGSLADGRDAMRGHVRTRTRTMSVNAETFAYKHKDEAPVYSNYGFLFLGYEEHAYYWEVCVMTRKALISLIGVALATDQRAQVRLSISTQQQPLLLSRLSDLLLFVISRYFRVLLI